MPQSRAAVALGRARVVREKGAREERKKAAALEEAEVISRRVALHVRCLRIRGGRDGVAGEASSISGCGSTPRGEYPRLA